MCLQYDNICPNLQFLKRSVAINPMESTMECSAVTAAPASSNDQFEEALSIRAYVSMNKYYTSHPGSSSMVSSRLK